MRDVGLGVQDLGCPMKDSAKAMLGLRKLITTGITPMKALISISNGRVIVQSIDTHRSEASDEYGLANILTTGLIPTQRK